MKTLLTADFSLADLYEHQSHTLLCLPVTPDEARDQLKYGFLSVVSTEETARELSELLGVPVSVGEEGARLEIKTCSSLVVAQAAKQGMQFWYVILQTTYQESALVPQPIPSDEKWCLTCGFSVALCECEQRILKKSVGEIPTISQENTEDFAVSDESWLL